MIANIKKVGASELVSIRAQQECHRFKLMADHDMLTGRLVLVQRMIDSEAANMAEIDNELKRRLPESF